MPGNTGLGVQVATGTSVRFTDGTGFEFDGSRVMMLVPGSANTLLCPDIDSVEVRYLAKDGITSTLTTPTDTHRIVVVLTSGQLRMSIIAHPRIWIGQGDAS